MAKKRIKVIKTIKPKIKEVKKSSSPKINSHSDNLEEEIEEGDTETLAKLLSKRRSAWGANSSLEQQEIVGDRIIRTIPQNKEDEAESHFRPSYIGTSNSPYQSNQAYQGSEFSGGGQIRGEVRSQEQDIGANQLLDNSQNQSNEQSQRGEGAQRRDYASSERKSGDKRKAI